MNGEENLKFFQKMKQHTILINEDKIKEAISFFQQRLKINEINFITIMTKIINTIMKPNW